MMTFAPARPSAAAMARPMPREPPVTTATRPASSPMGCLPRDGRLPERRNGVGVGRAVDFDRGRDALDEAREDAARPDLDGLGDAERRDRQNRLLPTDRARDLPRE